MVVGKLPILVIDRVRDIFVWRKYMFGFQVYLLEVFLRKHVVVKSFMCRQPHSELSVFITAKHLELLIKISLQFLVY